MNKHTKALIFDMDGVIINNDEYHCRAWQMFSGKYGKPVSFQEVKTWFGSTNASILRNLLGNELDEDEILTLSREKEVIYRKIYNKEIKPLNGLRKFIDNPGLKDWKMGLATSAPPENVEFVLEKTGLTNTFDAITDDTQISNGKPDPEIFLKTAEKLRVLPARVIVFEDSFHGIEASRKAGMKVIGVATTHESGQLTNTDMVIKDFHALTIDDLNSILEDT